MLSSADSPLESARRLAEGRGLVYLDSSDGQGSSRLFWDPAAVLRCKDAAGELEWADGRTERSGRDPFRWLQDLLAQHPDWSAAGYWGYDLRYHLERLPRLAHDDLRLPDCCVGLYSPANITEFHVSSFRSHLAGPETQPRQARAELQVPGSRFQVPEPDTPRPATNSQCQAPHSQDPTPNAQLRQEVSRAEYEAAVCRVLDYISAGDCYQVNLSHRLSAPTTRAPWELYERLRQASPAPYSAYLDCGTHQVLSSSPELFLRVRGREVETRPIKGTRPRGETPAQDAAHAQALLASEKDRAELLMIVDLERNDLGRVCEYGSVRVPELFRLESYANVHHLVATVAGRLRSGVGPLECLRAAFPGGSITGAPKIRAMEIIEELEPVRRGVYTGAIGWVDGSGDAEWNIAIRTMTAVGGRVYFHVGGGIVADSDPAAEYQETLDKARGMLDALGR